MSLKDWGFIFRGDIADPSDYGAEFNPGGARVRIAGVCTLDQAAEVAREWAADGVQVIELCGWFGAEGAESIFEAVDGTVAVGFVSPTARSGELMAAIFG